MRTPIEPNWTEEFPYESKSMQLGAVRFAYVDEGEGEAPIVAVHGNPTWSFYWRSLISRFKSTNRVLAVDHIGCGNSDKPQQYPYCLATHRDNLVEWMDRLDLRNITLCVHDWGGAIGLSAALERPERIGRIVITNTGAFPPPYIPLRISMCRLPLFGTLAVRGLNAFAVAALTMATSRYSRLPQNSAAGLLAPYNTWANRVAIDRFVKDIPMRNTHPTYQVLERVEQRLTELSHLPKLMVWGMKDWCFRPECLERFESIWPEAKVVRLDDVGHYVMEDGPEETCKAIASFLEEHANR